VPVEDHAGVSPTLVGDEEVDEAEVTLEESC